ncbi:uncharacterized protein I303_101304 [Kwoniella dejecticola CBS 10117]|uniref:Uncharacterized protein n=1 Tax=Kwoniella dejecticola CBS 10117 TaxID=1296121 RepID=A0A1A6AHD3_9TREE|nr:uncharacterized protein I303_01312 [Kwoniella dejecticola CBS 10117]OBR89485.1 hypothetical protein I303_01312 [Kwoniella dejecticola CBS 10117]
MPPPPKSHHEAADPHNLSYAVTLSQRDGTRYTIPALTCLTAAEERDGTLLQQNIKQKFHDARAILKDVDRTLEASVVTLKENSLLPTISYARAPYSAQPRSAEEPGSMERRLRVEIQQKTGRQSVYTTGVKEAKDAQIESRRRASRARRTSRGSQSESIFRRAEITPMTPILTNAHADTSDDEHEEGHPLPQLGPRRTSVSFIDGDSLEGPGSMSNSFASIG